MLECKVHEIFDDGEKITIVLTSGTIFYLPTKGETSVSYGRLDVRFILDRK